MKNQLSYKRIRGNEKEFSHIKVYLNNEYLGYYIKSGYSLKDNWFFDSKSDLVRYFNSSTVKELKDTLQKQVNKDHVILKQHFGIILELNKK